jgi:hypothetical protein
MYLLRRALAGIASAFGVMCLVSILLYPIYKHLYAGFVLVFVGALLAVTPRITPALTQRIADRLSTISTQRWLLSLAIAGFLVRLPLILFPPPHVGDFLFYLQHGVSIAEGHGYGEAINYPPGQSGWLSFWIRLGGADLHYLVLIQCLVSLATVWVIYAGFARYSVTAARWASATVAFYPSIVIWSGVLGHETLVMLLSAILLWMSGKAAEARKGAWQWWVLCGLITGATALVRPTFVIAPVLMAVCLALSAYKPARALAAGATMFICMLAVIAPWTWRNYQMFHGFALISTNFGSTLLSSNHPLSDGIYMHTEEFGRGLDPIEAGKVEQKMAMDAIKADPARFVRLSFKRIVYMWGAETNIADEAYGPNPALGQGFRQALRALVQLFWVAFVFACVLGTPYFLQTWTFREVAVLWAILWSLAIWCLHAVIEPQGRHHMALIPLLAGIYLPSYEKWITRPR